MGVDAVLFIRTESAIPAMVDDSALRFSFPAVCGRKTTVAFDGGRLTSDGGVLLLAQAERRMGLATALAGCIADRRDQSRVIHDLDDILRARMLAIACGGVVSLVATRLRLTR